MNEIELRGVTQRFGEDIVLHPTNLHIPKGKVLGIIGHIGSGKTTLLKAMAGIPDSGAILEGDIFLQGKRANELKPEARGIGFLFQDAPLAKTMTVEEDVAIKLRAEGIPRKERPKAIREILQFLGINEKLASERCWKLSGGEGTLAALAGILVGESPRILFFDEPCINLDQQIKIELREKFSELFRRLGKTVIYVCHDQEEAAYMCDEIALMHEGKIIQTGTWSDLYQKPANCFVAKFIGDPPMNFLDITLPSWQCYRKTEGVRTLGIRPEEIILASSEDGAEARVENIVPLDPRRIVRLRTAEGTSLLAVTQRDVGLCPGQNVRFKIGAHHLFDAEGNRIEHP